MDRDGDEFEKGIGKERLSGEVQRAVSRVHGSMSERRIENR